MKQLNNLTMTSDELLESLIDIPELEEIFKYILEDRYIMLLNSLDIKLVSKK